MALSAKHSPAFAQRLLQRILHVFKAVFVDQRPNQVAFQRVTNAHPGIGCLEPGDDFFLDRLMGDQPPQAGTTLACGAHGTEQNRPDGHVQIRARGEDHGVIATQFQNAASEPCGDLRSHFTPHTGAACGADQRYTRVIDQGFAGVTPANNHLAEVRGGIVESAQDPIKQGLAGQRGKWGFLGRFPDHRVAAHQCQRSVPGPDRNREVEGADHPDHTQRVPGFAHVVTRTLGGNGQTIKLARQAHCEIADVDHFLDLTQAFLGDLARLPGHQLPPVRLVLAQQIAELAHQFATAWRRHLAPGLECMLGTGDVLLGLGGTFPVHGADPAAINRRMNRLVALLVQGGVHTKTIQ